jgi:hypothetical protein
MLRGTLFGGGHRTKRFDRLSANGSQWCCPAGDVILGSDWQVLRPLAADSE